MGYYVFNKFKKMCSENHESIILIDPVLKTAKEDFNLLSKTEILDFISNDGLEELSFVNTKEWELNPDKKNPIMVDAYKFRSMNRIGYIAFMFNEKTEKWIIKSFHLSDDRNPVFYYAFKKAGLLEKEQE